MMKLFSYPRTRGTRVTWMLEELGAPYEYELVPFGDNGFASPAFLQVNPGGKVPALQDGALTLTESAAIVAYLGDKFPTRGLVPPAGSPERARHDQWCYFVLSELEQPLWTKGKHRFILPKDLRVPAIVETANWEFQKALGILSQGLGDKPFILGDDFTAADILIGHTLTWAEQAKQSIDPQNVRDYAGRLRSREACKRTREKEAALAGDES